MTPGPEMDKAVAATVMGWPIVGAMFNGVPLCEANDGTRFPVPRYSTYGGSAADLAHFLARVGYPVTVSWKTTGTTRATVGGASATGVSFAHALCLAALEAVGVEVPA